MGFLLNVIDSEFIFGPINLRFLLHQSICSILYIILFNPHKNTVEIIIIVQRRLSTEIIKLAIRRSCTRNSEPTLNFYAMLSSKQEGTDDENNEDK